MKFSMSLICWLASLVTAVDAYQLDDMMQTYAQGRMRIKLLGADAILYLLWCAPAMVWLNFCGGVVLARLFSSYSHRMGSLYATDLLGATAQPANFAPRARVCGPREQRILGSDPARSAA